MEKEEQKAEDYKKDEKDKFEKSLPFFYVKDGITFARSPQKSPILNVKLRLGSMENDFTILGEINTIGSVHTEHNISIGGLVDGDEINVDNLLAKNKIAKHTRWFVVSATTVTNDTIYFVYLPYLKIGWHFYEKEDFGKSKIVKYIGDDTYCKLARLLAMHISDSRDEFSYKDSILNDVVAYLEKNDLKGAFAHLIVFVREVKEIQK